MAHQLLLGLSGHGVDLLDERLRVVGVIFQSVGISAVVWGSDALHHHAICTGKTVPFVRFDD